MEKSVEIVDKPVEKHVESVKKGAVRKGKRVFYRFHRGDVENLSRGEKREKRDNSGYKKGIITESIIWEKRTERKKEGVFKRYKIW